MGHLLEQFIVDPGSGNPRWKNRMAGHILVIVAVPLSIVEIFFSPPGGIAVEDIGGRFVGFPGIEKIAFPEIEIHAVITGVVRREKERLGVDIQSGQAPMGSLQGKGQGEGPRSDSKFNHPQRSVEFPFPAVPFAEYGIDQDIELGIGHVGPLIHAEAATPEEEETGDVSGRFSPLPPFPEGTECIFIVSSGQPEEIISLWVFAGHGSFEFI